MSWNRILGWHVWAGPRGWLKTGEDMHTVDRIRGGHSMGWNRIGGGCV